MHSPHAFQEEPLCHPSRKDISAEAVVCTGQGLSIHLLGFTQLKVLFLGSWHVRWTGLSHAVFWQI